MDILIAFSIHKWGIKLMEVQGSLKINLLASAVVKSFFIKRVLKVIEGSKFTISGQIAIDNKQYEIIKNQVV